MQQHNNYVGATQNVLCTDVLGTNLWLARTFSCPLRLSEDNWTWRWQQQGVRGCRFVGLASFVASWVSGMWRWSVASDGSFWVIVEMKTSKEVVWIFRRCSTSRSLNSCVDCKISTSVTSKALKTFRVIWKCTKNMIAYVTFIALPYFSTAVGK